MSYDYLWYIVTLKLISCRVILFQQKDTLKCKYLYICVYESHMMCS